MAIDPATPRSRRAILGAALGGAGALFAHALGRATPVAADDNDPILLGRGSVSSDNDATLPTIVNSSSSPGLAVLTDGGIDGKTAKTALEGTSASGIGVLGVSNGPVDPGNGRSTGIVGLAGGGGALDPNVNTDETGVYGFADISAASAGVWGDAIQGTGVVGTGDWGVYGIGAVGIVGDADSVSNGVYGFSGDEPIQVPFASAGVLGAAGTGGGVGVRGHAGTGGAYGMIASASSTAQFALYVSGKLRLSRSGKTSFSSTATSKKITLAGVTSSSFVVATLQTSISGCYVRAVVCGTGYFYIYLSKAPGKTAYAGYVVVN